jgi:hypothetical protein
MMQFLPFMDAAAKSVLEELEPAGRVQLRRQGKWEEGRAPRFDNLSSPMELAASH